MIIVQSIFFKSLDPMIVIKLSILIRADMTKREDAFSGCQSLLGIKTTVSQTMVMNGT